MEELEPNGRATRALRRLAPAVGVALATGLALVTAGCGGSPTARRTPVVRAPSATPRPSPTALPSPRELLSNGGLGVIEVAFNRIVDEHVTPVDEAALLSAAWDGVQTAARMANLASPASPAFTGDRDADIARFENAWLHLPEALREFAPTRWTAISSMADSLHDCHTYFLGPSLNDPGASAPQERAISGFGMTLTGKPPVVAEIEKEPWSPAAASGLQAGDTILDIGGEHTAGKSPLEVLRLLSKGEDGTSVEIRAQRPGQSEPTMLTLNRSPYTPVNIQTQVLDGNIGYVRIHDWTDGRLTQRLRDALARLDKSSVKSWIIDLRGNPGGLVSVDPISLFLADGIAIRARERDGTVTNDPVSGDVLPAIRPLDILVDDGTASMSEIFALALQEHHVARIVGAETDGCIGETLIDDIGDGSGLAVTFETMLGPTSGVDLNGVGVTPDRVVARTVDDIVSGHDPQLDAAVADLQER